MRQIKTILAGLCLTIGAATGSAQAGTEPYLGQLNLYAGIYCPRGTAEANGQILPISDNEALYSLFGTYYGGDGRTSFGLPDLRGRTAVGATNAHPLSSRFGKEETTLVTDQLPAHSHSFGATTETTSEPSPTGALFGEYPGQPNVYSDDTAAPSVPLTENTIGATGGDPTGATTPINNMQPSLAMLWCVALTGQYPPRNN